VETGDNPPTGKRAERNSWLPAGSGKTVDWPSPGSACRLLLAPTGWANATSRTVSRFLADRHACFQACFRSHACLRLAGGLVRAPPCPARLGLRLPLAPRADGLAKRCSVRAWGSWYAFGSALAVDLAPRRRPAWTRAPTRPRAADRPKELTSAYGPISYRQIGRDVASDPGDLPRSVRQGWIVFRPRFADACTNLPGLGREEGGQKQLGHDDRRDC